MRKQDITEDTKKWMISMKNRGAKFTKKQEKKIKKWKNKTKENKND